MTSLSTDDLDTALIDLSSTSLGDLRLIAEPEVTESIRQIIANSVDAGHYGRQEQRTF